jgi:hypothetical protein
VATRTPTITSYRDDPLYPRIARAVDALLSSGNVVTPVDVLIGMGLLTREQLEDWRRGRMPYLERIINCNLARLGRLLRILRFHAHDLNLKPSWTAYMRWGKGPKQRLRFSKSGDPKVEEAYATHFVWPGKRPFHPPGPSAPAAVKRRAVDIKKLRVALRWMSRSNLLMAAERAIEIVPNAKLVCSSAV